MITPKQNNVYPDIVYRQTGDTIYIAEVDFGEAENESVTPFNGIYKYSATLYYKQFSPITDSENFEKDTELGQYKAADIPIVLLSAWDMEILTSDTATKVIVPCVRKNDNFESLVTIPPTSTPPDDSITNDNFGRSIGLRTYEEDGTIYIGLELLGFFDGLIVSDKLEDLLEADTDTGVISGKNADKYKLLVRVDDGSGRPRLSYMRIHPSAVEDPSEEETSEDCGIGDFPGTLPNDNDSGEFPGDGEEDVQNEFPGQGSEPDGDEFPGKVDDCW